jgi:nucleotide-binding universal stress UspA family protein
VGGTTVVVGLDGSADAGTALAFAIEEAAMRHYSLRVVTAVELPDYGLAAPTMVTLPPPEHLVNDVRKPRRPRLTRPSQHRVMMLMACRSL